MDGMPSEQALNRAKIAALVYGPGVDPSPVLVEIVRALQKRGVALAGAIQHSAGPCSMSLEILPSGVRIPISQALGSGATGCRLDSAALAEAASMVRRTIDAATTTDPAPSLVVFNKFGAQEADGSGLYDEMAAAMIAGMPVLTAVNEALLPQWTAFTGGEFAQLDCAAKAALAWWDGIAAN
jgi:hypothetical protein